MAMSSPASTTAARPMARRPIWAFAQPSADDDLFGAAPGFEAEKASRDRGHFGGKFLDHGVDEARGDRIVPGQDLIEPRFRQVLRCRVSERIVTAAPEALTPVFQDRAEGTPTRAITDEAGLVPQLLVVGIDADGGQDATAVRQHGLLLGQLGCGDGHAVPRERTFNVTAAGTLRRTPEAGPQAAWGVAAVAASASTNRWQ